MARSAAVATVGVIPADLVARAVVIHRRPTAAAPAPAHQTRPAPLTIDLDLTIVSVCGRGKQGTAFG